MKNKYKRIISLIFVLLVLFTLAGCKTTNNPSSSISLPDQSTSGSESLPSWKSGKTVEGVKITYSLTDQDIITAREYMASSLELVNNGNDFDELNRLIDWVNDYNNRLADAIKCEQLLFDLYGTDEHSNKHLKYETAQVEHSQWAAEILHAMYNSPNKSIFFEGMTEDEILALIGTKYPQRYYDLQNEQNQINAAYFKLDIGASNYVTEADKLYKQLMDVNKEYVGYLGYDNYLQYSYDYTYERDYSISLTDSFYQYAITYVLPKFIEAKAELKSTVDKLNKEEKAIYDFMADGDAFKDGFNYIEDYFDFFGDFVNDYADDLFKEGGYYYISYEDKSKDGAYQSRIRLNNENHGYVFFGKRYHSPYTVIHEFGHYMASMTGGERTSYDVAETQSQGNEYMFLNYLTNHSNYGFSDNLKKALRYARYADNYQSIIMGVVINEVEKACYSGTYEIGDLVNEIKSMYTSNPLLEQVYPIKHMDDYTMRVAVETPGYFISYSTSLMGSLYIDKLAQSDYARAKEAYKKLVYNNEHIYNISSLYEKCGLGDPFDENTFIYIFSN